MKLPGSGQLVTDRNKTSRGMAAAEKHLKYLIAKSRRMIHSSDDEDDDQSTPLVQSTHTPMTSRYVDMALISQARGVNPRFMFHTKLGERIEHRKQLLQRRRWLVDLTLSVALVGIGLMVVENEFYYIDDSEKGTTVSMMLKTFISISTAVLLVAICLYYHTGAEIKMLDARVDDPLAVMSFTTWACLAAELVVCAIHPFPGDILVYMSTVAGNMDRVHLDGILSVLMMFRVYLMGRFLVVHSPLLTNQSTQTISAVSHVKISMFFVFKAAMTEHPGKVIALTMLSMYSMSVWAMRTCEIYYTGVDEASSFSQSAWLSAITFLTVGYGDIVPETHCGRFIAICTGLMGHASTALMVAVVAKKLEQTRSEKSVYNYLTLIHLEHRRKEAAADVIKFSIRVYSLKTALEKNYSKTLRMTVTYFKWRLSNAIRAMRATRYSRLRVEETSVGLTELSQQVSQTQSLIAMLATTQGLILDKLTDLQGRSRFQRDMMETEDDCYSMDETTGKSEDDQEQNGWPGVGLFKNLVRRKNED